MRLAQRFRPRVSTKLTRANGKKNAARIASNYAILKSLAAAAEKPAKKTTRAKKAAAPKAE